MSESTFDQSGGSDEEEALTAEAFMHAAQSRRNVSPRLITVPLPAPEAAVEPVAEDLVEPARPVAASEPAPVEPVVEPAEYVLPTPAPLPPSTVTRGLVTEFPAAPAPAAAAAPLAYPAPIGPPTNGFGPSPMPGPYPPMAGSDPAGGSYAAAANPYATNRPPPAGQVPPVGAPSAPAGPDHGQGGASAGAGASPAQWGWRRRVRQVTGGLVAPSAGADEAAYRADVASVQRIWGGPRTVVFVNPKGGAGTTTSTLMAGHIFGTFRAGGVVAWDNNETRGTLGSRAMRAGHTNTARELLQDIGKFEDPLSARPEDLGLYLRGQGPSGFDVLASDDRPEVTGHIDRDDVARLHRLFCRYYRLVLVDTGNNLRAANWLAAVQAADLLVVTTTTRIDAANSAVWMLDSLERQMFGAGRLKDRTVTVLSEPAPKQDPHLANAMERFFSGRSRAVCRIPYDPALVDGGPIDHTTISPRSHRAWLHACAAISAAL